MNSNLNFHMFQLWIILMKTMFNQSIQIILIFRNLKKLYDTVSAKHFSLFHISTRNLSKNFDQLLTVLSGFKINFDVIGISETTHVNR